MVELIYYKSERTPDVMEFDEGKTYEVWRYN